MSIAGRVFVYMINIVKRDQHCVQNEYKIIGLKNIYHIYKSKIHIDDKLFYFVSIIPKKINFDLFFVYIKLIYLGLSLIG